MMAVEPAVMKRATLVVVAAALAIGSAASNARAQDLPLGTIIDDVQCAADPSQSYALYVPSHYSPDRKWSLLIAFDPGARGRALPEKCSAAAAEYGEL